MDYSEIEIFLRGQAMATLISLSCLLLLMFLQMSFTGILGVIASFRIKFFVSIKKNGET